MADYSSTLEAEQVPETRSRYMKETITGAFNLVVTKYGQIKGKAVGEFISSSHFIVAGYHWRINFHPNGMNADSAGSASAYVQLTSRGKDAVAKFTMSVLKSDGRTTVVSQDATKHVYSRDSNDWGFLQFVAKRKLKSLSRHGGFTIRCVLTVMHESPPMELIRDLEGMLQDGTSADITFGVRGRDFRAHRNVLAARSPVFRAELFGSMMEKDMPRLEVVDMDAAIFEMMLHYIYTESVPPCSSDEDEGDNVFQHLLVAADRYGLERLKMICEEELCKRMDVETVKVKFMLAKQRKCKRLEDTCLDFMSSIEVLRVVLENVSLV